MTMYHKIENLKVYESSIMILDLKTMDCDAWGYELTNGTNRRLSCGITTEGKLLLYITTNGDDVLIPDDIDLARDACWNMGDLPDDDDTRTRTGANRILAACRALNNIYHHNVATAEDIGWYRDKMGEVEADLDRGN